MNMHEYENVYLTATTTNGDQAGQIKQGAIDSSYWAIYIRTDKQPRVSTLIKVQGAAAVVP